MPTRIFLLSPARLDGARARLLFNPDAAFPLARALGAREGAALSDVFSFLSGLYFRGKHAYAQKFGRPSARVAAVHIITTTRGLLPPETRVTRCELEAFAEVDLSAADHRFHAPLLRDASRIRAALDDAAEVVLLGSIATGKYVDPLLTVFGPRLHFPETFVGRGDMSRGGILLRRARAEEELTYIPVSGAVRHGRRPPKLARAR
ncbi:MAG TPA: hypothetical protein VLD17_04090 [Gemmatimonadaceae bacterium]|nr:hypothetical protein [Gemmatimonadaceae bacterium]